MRGARPRRVAAVGALHQRERAAELEPSATIVATAQLPSVLVAAEMRRLAERVNDTVADVGTRVGDIEGSGASTVESREPAQHTAVATRVISAVSRRQGADTQHASKADELERLIGQFQTGAERAGDANQRP